MKTKGQSYIFRKSHIVLISRLILLEIILVSLYLVIRIPKIILFSSIMPDYNATVNILGVIYFIVLSSIELIFVLQIALGWANEEYEIREDSLVHRKGILTLKQVTYTLRNLGSAKINQGPLGKIFNFGTIIITSPILKGDIILSDIHNPSQVLSLFEDNINQSTVKDANIIKRLF